MRSTRARASAGPLRARVVYKVEPTVFLPEPEQQPMCLSLEDETGLINIVCSKGCWLHHRQIAGTATALLVRGRVENVEGVINVVAERIEPLHLAVPMASRDFR